MLAAPTRKSLPFPPILALSRRTMLRGIMVRSLTTLALPALEAMMNNNVTRLREMAAGASSRNASCLSARVAYGGHEYSESRRLRFSTSARPVHFRPFALPS